MRTYRVRGSLPLPLPPPATAFFSNSGKNGRDAPALTWLGRLRLRQDLKLPTPVSTAWPACLPPNPFPFKPAELGKKGWGRCRSPESEKKGVRRVSDTSIIRQSWGRRVRTKASGRKQNRVFHIAKH